MRTSENEAARHLVLVSIGNTNVLLASWVDGVRDEAERLPIEPIDAVIEQIEQCWDRFPDGANRAVVVSSVCPPVLAELRVACDRSAIGPLLVVGQDLSPPIPADVLEPEKVGTDRLCVAAAAFERVREACVVADFGTAVTIDLIADNGVFLGGTILPGMALSARALHEHTALLPLVEVGPTTATLGKDTASAIRNGILAMMVGAVREIAERYATQIGKWPPLILAGGDAQTVADACNFADAVAPDLCLDGLALAYRLHTMKGATGDNE